MNSNHVLQGCSWDFSLLSSHFQSLSLSFQKISYHYYIVTLSSMQQTWHSIMIKITTISIANNISESIKHMQKTSLFWQECTWKYAVMNSFFIELDFLFCNTGFLASREEKKKRRQIRDNVAFGGYHATATYHTSRCKSCGNGPLSHLNSNFNGEDLRCCCYEKSIRVAILSSNYSWDMSSAHAVSFHFKVSRGAKNFTCKWV